MKSHARLLALLASISTIAAAEPTPLSPETIVATRDGARCYLTAATARRALAVTLSDGKVQQSIPLPGDPTGLALSPDGAALVVTCGGPPGTVARIDTATGKVTGQFPAGHTPVAPVFAPDGKTLYLCNRFDNSISALDPISGKASARVPVQREPIAAAIAPDGATLVVANHLPVGPADGDVIAACVSLIDTKANRRVKDLQLPNGSSSLRGVCVSPDGKFAYVTHLLSRYHLPTTQLERGWMNTNALSVVDLQKRELLNTVLLDEVDLGAANPWGVACSPDGKWLCVTHAGTQELSVIDRAALHDKLAKAAASQQVTAVTRSAADVPNDLSFLVDLRRRIHLAGIGPRGLVVAGASAVAAEYFSDSIGLVALDPNSTARPRSLPVGPRIAPSLARKGEILFHDADLCFQHWQSCTSCHPDSRADSLNWDLLNDGIGNPKQTKSMVHSHVTPPAMMSGVRDSAEAAVRSGIRFIQFVVRPEEDAVAIDAYLKSLRPVPSPHLVGGKLSEAAARGQKVFEQAGCAACHSGKYHTSLEAYDVGTAKGLDAGKEYDTPGLFELWRTAPYLSDGRSADLEQMLTGHNPGDRHGHTSGLTPEQRKDLIAYLLSL